MTSLKRRIEILERRRPPGYTARVIIYEATEVPEEPAARKLYFARLRSRRSPNGVPVIFLPNNHRD